MVYTDGYGDNVFTENFPDCISKYLNKETKYLENVSRAADCQARKAYILGKKPNYKSPFAVGAAKANLNFNGGKHDDISVIVAQFHLSEVSFKEDVEYFLEDKYLYTVEDGDVTKMDWQARVAERNAKNSDAAESTAESTEEL